MILVTGAAGFIGSRLCHKLLGEGREVMGIDSLTDFYPRWMKERNLQPLRKNKKIEFIEADLNRLDLKKILNRVEYVFHLAAQPGVRASWGENFAVYSRNNIEATQKLLEAAKGAGLKKFIYASSSSVYGLCPELPMRETSPLRPYSPYGVTKLAAEHLCFLYHHNYGLPCVSLRFFTVFGPGQRPDMAFHVFFKTVLEGRPISLYGDGQQTRDFTYIDDIVQANLACLENGRSGEVYNVGGGHQKKLIEVFPLLEEVARRKITIKKEERQKGDVPHTFASIEKARQDLGYLPRIPLEAGLQEEWRWVQHLYSS